jgi:hypothetical protein
MMLEELECRNYSAGTTRRYLRFVERFAQHFGKSPDKLGPDDLRSYQAYLLRELKLCPGSVENHVAALRFFYVRTLRRHEFREFLPYPKSPKKLPSILSQEEVARLINARSSLFQRTLLMVLYGTGMRRSELVRVKMFLLPVPVLRRVFRKKFLAGLCRLHHRGLLNLRGPAAPLRDPAIFEQLIEKLENKNWYVYAKPPFGGPEHVLRYLGRYTHRMAISNHRITAFDGNRVSFRWRDYAHGGKQRVMTLDAVNFLCRFFLHVLPRGFVRACSPTAFANSCCRWRALCLPNRGANR